MGDTMQIDKSQLSTGVCIYLISGILQPIAIDYLRINHLLGHKFLLLPTLANTSGMALCGFLANRNKWEIFLANLRTSPKLKKMVMITALVDLLSGMFLTLGMLSTGGSIFVILYNSCPAWTALLSRVLLGKKLNVSQMGGVLLVCVGLCLNIIGSRVQLDHNSDGTTTADGSTPESAGTENTNSIGIMAGCFFVLLGSFLHSLMFVLSDLSMNTLHLYEAETKRKKSFESSTDDSTQYDHLNVDNGGYTQTKTSSGSVVTGEIWSCCLGTIETCFMLMWVTVGICIHGFDENIKAISGDLRTSIMTGFLGLVFIDAIHAGAFFTLLKNMGAVASALLKGIQAVVVVGFSAVVYCPTEESGCLNWIKSASVVAVLSGVFGYSIGSKEI